MVSEFPTWFLMFYNIIIIVKYNMMYGGLCGLHPARFIGSKVYYPKNGQLWFLEINIILAQNSTTEIG